LLIQANETCSDVDYRLGADWAEVHSPQRVARGRVTIPLFFFDYFDGQQLHQAEDGLELRDVDAAYLEAFTAATEIWGEALRARRNPDADAFRIRDRTGMVVLELPFTEILESSRGRRLPSPPKRVPSTSAAVEFAAQSVSKGRRIVVDQQNRVAFLKMLGRDSREAERTLGLFTRSLAIFEDYLNTIRTMQR
jgi:hypothetical protein